MNAVWTLCVANLREKKIQNGLTALLILLATLLLATSVNVILTTGNLFTAIHEKTNGSHQILKFTNKLHDPRMVNDWWSKQDGVATSKLLPFKNLTTVMYEGQEIPNLYLYMMNTPELPFGVDEPTFVKGDVRSNPATGTIWISTALAYAHGMSLGDHLGFTTGLEKFELEVSAIVIDVPYGAPFSNGIRIWMNTEDYQEKLSSMQVSDMYMMGLRFNDYSQNAYHWDRFENFLGTPFLESKDEFETISAFYLIINKVIAFAMSFLGVVMMSIALITIGFTISDAILSNYKTIGVLKSLGLSANKIILTYVSHYSFLAIISIIPGLLLSHFSSKLIVESSLSNLEMESTTSSIHGGMISLVVGVFVFLLVFLCVLIYSNKTRSIEPAQAIRYGMSEVENSKMTKRLGSSGVNKFGFASYPVAFVIGLRNLLKNRKGSLLIMVLATVTSAVLVFGFVLLNSIVSIEKTMPLWGYDSSDISVVVFNKAAFSRGDFEKEMLVDERVETIGWMGDELSGIFPSEGQTTGSKSVSLDIMDGNYDELGFATLKGNNPKNKNEIALGINVAKHLNKDIGDVTEVYIDGNKHTLTVTGIYQTIREMSNSARITVDVVKVYKPDYYATFLGYIMLKNTADSDDIAAELNAKYKNSVNALAKQTLIDSVFKEAVSILIVPMSIMGLMFVLVTFIIIYSTCRMNIRKESKTYGIYKSVGMTSIKIRQCVTSGVVVLSTIGALLGIVVGTSILPIVMESVLSSYGIVELPLLFNWGGILPMACISIVSAGFGSWLSSRIIAKTSPRILVVE
ncbi:ABC transporter permease [Sporosarcina limicola]|uniref:ABC transport system permease protein n=1 Tax=Sporosarcina limicola TaxID=34101 RepID=A0A927MKJ0_9BACL|nr:FtsX-like permease family protein [Sporosarcina limicola]MBE1555576.1 putative ABC transport system permease protein [Sporosarcina limicola]